MRTIQEIFDAVIAAGLYSMDHDEYMCPALKRACNCSIVTLDERDNAIGAIRVYIADELGSRSISLAAALDDAGLLVLDGRDTSYWFGVCLSIYQDWDNRPMPAQQETAS